MRSSKIILKYVETEGLYQTQKITVELNDTHALDEVLEGVQSFLQAVGFTWVDGLSSKLDIVPVDENTDEEEEQAEHMTHIVEPLIEGYSRDADGNMYYTGESYLNRSDTPNTSLYTGESQKEIKDV